jgi:hypothetical protein
MKEIKFKLVTEKKDQEGRCPIYLFFNYQSYQFRYFTKEKVKPKDWDAAKMRFKRSYPGFQQANDRGGGPLFRYTRRKTPKSLSRLHESRHCAHSFVTEV